MARICQMSHVEATFNFLAPLIHHLAGEGHEVVVACAMDEEGKGLRRHLGPAGYETLAVPLSRRLRPGLLGADLATLTGALRRGGFDILHLHGPLPGVQGRLAAHQARIPLVIHQAHGFWFHAAMPLWQRGPATVLEWVLGRCCTDRLVVVNREDEALARRWRFRPRPEEILRVPGVGVDTRRFRPPDAEDRAARAALGLPPQGRLVAFVGRVVREKGLRELVEALEILFEHHPDLHLIVMGEALPSDRDRDTSRWLRRRSLLRPGRIHLLGRRHDVDRVLRAVDLFCLPTHREGMPVALLEAMASGLPCVATDVRGAREALGSPPAGLLVPARNPAALARALDRLLEDPATSRRLGLQARERVQREYCVEAALAPLADLYRDLLPASASTSS